MYEFVWNQLTQEAMYKYQEDNNNEYKVEWTMSTVRTPAFAEVQTVQVVGWISSWSMVALDVVGVAGASVAVIRRSSRWKDLCHSLFLGKDDTLIRMYVVHPEICDLSASVWCTRHQRGQKCQCHVSCDWWNFPQFLPLYTSIILTVTPPLWFFEPKSM